MIRRAFLIFLLLFCSSTSFLQGKPCYSEYWQKLFWNMWKKDDFSIGTSVKLETGDHLQNIRSIQINEQLQWDATDNFSLELHYAYIHSREVVPHSLWRWQHRLELEANYTFKLPCKYEIATRNRLEIRRQQATPKTLYRLRQLTMLVVPIETCGSLKFLSMYNELFYNASTHLFTQDRVCPLELTFALTDKVELDVFFLMRFVYVGDLWRKSAVFGTQLSF